MTTSWDLVLFVSNDEHMVIIASNPYLYCFWTPDVELTSLYRIIIICNKSNLPLQVGLPLSFDIIIDSEPLFTCSLPLPFGSFVGILTQFTCELPAIVMVGLVPLVWFCRAEENDIWAKTTGSALGAYTPCGIESIVGGISNVVLMGLCLYRIWLLLIIKVHRFCLRSNYYNYMLAFLAAYCAAEPLFRLLLDVSMFDFSAHTTLAPFEVVSLVIETLCWSSLVMMTLLETKVYVREFRWYVRFGVVYVLVGDIVKLSVILSVEDLYPRYILYVYISSLFCQALFGVLLLGYIPNLDSYLGHIPLQTDPGDDIKYEALPGGEHICPERRATILSRIYFGWMTPLMQEGYRKPITEKDVWTLDTWDQTETLSKKFQKCWAEEAKKSNPFLLRCLNNCVGGRSLLINTLPNMLPLDDTYPLAGCLFFAGSGLEAFSK